VTVPDEGAAPEGRPVLRLGAGGGALDAAETAALVVAVHALLADRAPARPPAPSGWRRAARMESLGAARVADLPDLRTRRP